MTVSIFSVTLASHNAHQDDAATPADAVIDAAGGILMSAHTSNPASRLNAGFYFADVGDTITSADGATILDAFLRLYSNKGADQDDPSGDFYAEESASPAVFTTDDGPTDRLRAATLTTESMNWREDNIGNNTSVDSPSMPKVIDEWLDDVSVVAGSDLAILWEAAETSNAHVFRVQSLADAGTDEAELHIEWVIYTGTAAALVAPIAATSKDSEPGAVAGALAAPIAATTKDASPGALAGALVTALATSSKDADETGVAGALVAPVAATTTDKDETGVAGALVAPVAGTTADKTTTAVAASLVVPVAFTTATTDKITSGVVASLVVATAATTADKPTTGVAGALVTADTTGGTQKTAATAGRELALVTPLAPSSKDSASTGVAGALVAALLASTGDKTTTGISPALATAIAFTSMNVPGQPALVELADHPIAGIELADHPIADIEIAYS